jgi:hypothetical protein
LVYYAAFGDADIFHCLRLSIESMLRFGRRRHEILLLTRADDRMTWPTHSGNWLISVLGLGCTSLSFRVRIRSTGASLAPA